MRNFMFGVIVGILLTAIGVQAGSRDGQGTEDPRRQLNAERERQFQLDLEKMRQQTELEQVRMQGRKKPC